MLGALSTGLRMTVTSSIAEGDRVALEVTSSGDLKNGRRYRQDYHFLIEFRDGRISAVREYLDTQHAHDVWIAPVSSQDAAGAARDASPDRANPAIERADASAMKLTVLPERVAARCRA